MKKLIVTILTLCMCISFVGCSDAKEKKNDNKNEAKTSSEATTMEESEEMQAAIANVTIEKSKEGYKTIVFNEPLVLLDDEFTKVEITKMYEKYVEWADQDPAVEKYLTFQIQNKTTGRISASFENVTLNGRELSYTYAYTNAYGNSPLAGETSTFNLGIRYRIDDEKREALDAIEDLYNVKGDLEMQVNVHNKNYTVPFSLKELITQQ